MAQAETVATSDLMATEGVQTVLGDEPVLAAALAAALLEYRHHVQQQRLGNRAPGTGENWRLVARLERLRGEA
jgi:hypothetical protein